jgi:plastocyanin
VYFADRMMRRIWLTGVVALAACAGTGAERAQDSVPAGGGAAAPAVHQVRMLVTDSGEYLYRPDRLTIRPGDRVRWINESGGPHNVAFIPDSVPAGALPVLNAAMADRLGGQDLVGPLLSDDGAVYEISFAGAPEGTYAYVCTPHEMVGMRATLTVTR